MWAVLRVQPLKPFSTTKPPPVNKGGSRQALIITAVKSNEPPHEMAVKSIKKTKSASAEKEESEMSGADVLMALQRATTVRKAKNKTQKRVSKSANNNNNNAAKEKTPSFSNIRPLCIQPEWTHRLEELETRLQQLAHT